MELNEVRAVRVRVASPTDFGESLLEFGVGTNDLVAWEVHKLSRSGTRSGSSARVGWLFLLEGFPCWVCNEPRHSILVKNPHSRHRIATNVTPSATFRGFVCVYVCE